ncbi:MAG: hypothetical protein HOC74_35865 [Gemmatimonadetes bacterium]|nr:hypothetical protein [Gemmatimonadota bacterium]
MVYKPHETEVEESNFIAVNFPSDDGFVDLEESMYWQEYRERDAVYQHIAIFDTAGTLLDSLPNLRGHQLYLKDVLGDGNRETIVSHIEGNEMGFFPVKWSIYMFTTSKKLKRVLEYPKAYYFADGSCKGCEFACFINRFHFYARDSLRIETVYFAEPCFEDGNFLPYLVERPAFSQGETVHFYFDKSADKFIPRE